MAINLADRLMPAFDTKSGIPWPRVNLRKGVLSYEVPEACTAGGGTLLLEFGTLSRLTGNPKYEKAAKKALMAIWSRRSSLNLFGSTMSLKNDGWIEKTSGIGASQDSFHEYLFKAYILFGDEQYLEMFKTAYAAIMKHMKTNTGIYSLRKGLIYKNVNMDTGNLQTTWVDSLAAFFPGLQVISGDINSAVPHHYFYVTLWKRYSSMPERFNFNSQDVGITIYPLRPELIESTYLLYQV